MSVNLLSHKWAQDHNIDSFYFPEVTSTNDVAKEEFAKSGKDFAIYFADHQTQGRGRGKNSWENLSGGEVLLSTWCFKKEANIQPIVTPLLGLALYEALFVFDSALSLRLKAPNDLYLEEGKLSGLLVEVTQQGRSSYVHVGLGLNVLASPEIDIPTSCLKDHTDSMQTFWFDFCKYLFNQFQMAIDKGTEPELTDDDCEDLLEAINAGLPEKEQYSQVAKNCDLHGPKGITPWTSL